jgi:1-acyl-sn-glycerol-3-phosphate acyltransferase
MQRFVKALIRVIAFFLIRLEVVGEDNFPEKGAYLLVANHIAAYDSGVVFMLVPHRIRGFAAAKHRRHLVYGLLLSLGNPIWVRRGEVDRNALREALSTLESGCPMGLAPEGTRARGTYALQRAKTGAAYLATRADVPILPIGLTGTEKIKENILKLRKTDVRVVIGEPFQLPESGRVPSPRLEEFTDLIMRRIAALLPEEYRGVYKKGLRFEIV